MRKRRTSRIVAIILCIVVVISFVGCKNKTESATDSFGEIMEAFKSGKESEITKYYKTENFEKLTNNDENLEKLLNATLNELSKMTYSVNSVTEVGNREVAISVDVTNINSAEVMQIYVSEVMAIVKSPEYQAKVNTMTQEEYKKIINDKMIEILSRDNIPMSTNTIAVKMIKSRGHYSIEDPNMEFFGAIFANLFKAMTEVMIK